MLNFILFVLNVLFSFINFYFYSQGEGVSHAVVGSICFLAAIASFHTFLSKYIL